MEMEHGRRLRDEAREKGVEGHVWSGRHRPPAYFLPLYDRIDARPKGTSHKLGAKANPQSREFRVQTTANEVDLSFKEWIGFNLVNADKPSQDDE